MLRSTEAAMHGFKVRLGEVILELERLPLSCRQRALLTQKLAHVGRAADHLVTCARAERTPR
jgi:hypothetical protein